MIKLTYTVFGRQPKDYTVHPYQLKQFNDRWFLLCSPVAHDVHPFNSEFIVNLPLDRIASDFEYVEDIPYQDTPVDLKALFDEIVGVTLNRNASIEEIYFAVHKNSLPYIQTKYIHTSQVQLQGEWEEQFRKKYPGLNEDWTFFSIECRPNTELYARFASYHRNIMLIEPVPMRKELQKYLRDAADNYSLLPEDTPEAD